MLSDEKNLRLVNGLASSKPCMDHVELNLNYVQWLDDVFQAATC
jgi:hypothetical protein